MSTPSRSTVQTSREQLDELDALLQRMLELPAVEPMEDPASEAVAERPASESPQLPSVTTVSSPGGLKRPSPRNELPPLRRSPRPAQEPARQPSYRTPTPPPPAPAVAVPAAPAAPPVPAEGPTIRIVPPGTTTAPKSATPIAKPVEPVVTVDTITATSAEAPLPLWRWPLGWINLLFDFPASRLGAPGRWARQPSGRKILGWTGVVLLSAAVILLFLEWIGWPP